MTKEQKELCELIYKETDIDLAYEIEHNMPDNIDDLMEVLEDRAREIEVIYYSNAMEYLAENDPSLQYSLGLAGDMGYEAKNINSELLATLLKQENVMEEVQEYRDELETAFFSN